jgi:hypothetical protein
VTVVFVVELRDMRSRLGSRSMVDYLLRVGVRHRLKLSRSSAPSSYSSTCSNAGSPTRDVVVFWAQEICILECLFVGLGGGVFSACSYSSLAISFSSISSICECPMANLKSRRDASDPDFLLAVSAMLYFSSIDSRRTRPRSRDGGLLSN